MADTEPKFSEFPFSIWLESVIREMYEINPSAIMLQMRDAEGKSYTCYWQVDADDRAVMLDAIQQDEWFDFIRNNRDLIAEILMETGDEEEGEEE